MSDTAQPVTAGEDQAQEAQSAAETTDTTPSQDTSVETPADPAQDAQSAQDGAQEDEGQDADVDTDEDDEVLPEDEQDRLDEKVRCRLSKTRREAANLRSRLKTETARADRAEVALAAGLPHDAMKFLTGNSREELETNAADLLAMLGYQGRVTPSGNPREVGVAPGVRGAEKTPDLDSIGARIYNHFN